MSYIYTNIYKHVGVNEYEPAPMCYSDWEEAYQAYKDENEQYYNEYRMDYHCTYVEDTKNKMITTIDLSEDDYE